MDTYEFEKVLGSRLKKIQDVLGSKATEYAVGDNRLHNFDVASCVGSTTPEKALKGMMLKHIVSVFDLIDFPGDATVELIDEKIGDNINYLILLEAMLLRRIS